jgi:hypothetical protein
MTRTASTWLFAIVTAALLDPRAAIAAPTEPRDEFFIISSVDADKHELLVKLPTEVTQVMRVDGATKYLDRRGQPIRLADFRAGDTVYIVRSPNTGAAREIRKGPMTLPELQRRYLRPARPQ